MGIKDLVCFGLLCFGMLWFGMGHVVLDSEFHGPRSLVSSQGGWVHQVHQVGGVGRWLYGVGGWKTWK